MAYTHFRFGAALAILLLGSTALVGPAQAGWLFGESNKDAKAETGTQSVKAGTDVKPAETLDGSIRQAQLLRTDGNYSEAIRHLSQLMMVASDDQRVISEYGKTLAAMGRAQEAINFLTRAQQLQPGDWTVHSALGVAYDQLGKQTEAKQAYEQALAIRPGEASILSNYALSRMLANDPDEAADEAEAFLKHNSLSAYYDEVAARALMLAQADVDRGVLDPMRQDRIHDAIKGLIVNLSDRKDDHAGSDLAPDWRDPDLAPVLCVAGRGPLDEAAALLLVDMLGKHGVGARVVSSDETSATNIAELSGDGVKLT